MSKKIAIYQLSAPHIHYAGEVVMEKEVFGGFSCTYCSGNGWNWGRNEENEPFQIKCPVCKGSGVLKATVVTRWEADTRHETGRMR